MGSALGIQELLVFGGWLEAYDYIVDGCTFDRESAVKSRVDLKGRVGSISW